MGGGVASCLAANGHRLHWVASGRSADTRRRAESAGAVAHESLERGLEALVAAGGSAIVLSICPPDNALEIAAAVAIAAAATGRPERIVFVDCNAVAPVTMRAAAAVVAKATAGQVDVVDGGIVGPPPRPVEPGRPASTRLFLAGTRATEVAALFEGSSLGTVVLEDADLGSASALKMVYAAWTKGSAALMLEVAAAAGAHGVQDALFAEWGVSKPSLLGQVQRAASLSGPKAWRWKGEMEEIAATFAEKGLPAGMPLGAAEVFRRLADFKDQDPPPSLDEVVAQLLS